MGNIDRENLINEIIQLDRQIGRSMAQEKLDAWLELNLTIGQLKSLFFIDFESGTSSRKLAAALEVTPPDITRIIDRLVEQKLVSREENPEDRRMQILKITDNGRALLSRLKEQRTSLLSGVLTQVDNEDLSSLARGLAAIIRAAKPIELV